MTSGNIPQSRFRVTRLGITMVLIILAVFLWAAISIPLRHSGLVQNQNSSIGSLRAIQAAQQSYSSTYSSVGFSCSLEHLGGIEESHHDASAAGLIDSLLAGGKKSGYLFAIANCNGAIPHRRYTVTAVPEQKGKTGVRAYCMDESGSIRFSRTGNAQDCLSRGEPLK